jgi:hypothetical protein
MKLKNATQLDDNAINVDLNLKFSLNDVLEKQMYFINL